MAFIFPNNTYIITYKCNQDDLAIIAEKIIGTGIRIVNEDDFDKFKVNIDKVKHLIACVVGCEKSSEMNFLEGLNVMFKSDSVSLDEFLDGAFKSKVPLGLSELMNFAFKSVSPLFFEELEFQFADQESINPNFDVMTMIDLGCPPYLGRGMLYANLKELNASSPSISEKSGEQIRDVLREFTNQFLGVINNNFNHIGYNASLGLPSQFDKADLESVTFSGPYIPSVIIADSLNRLQIKIGLVHSEGKDRPDFSNLDLEDHANEIDFF